MTNIRPLMERNFLEYASYVIVDRAIPDLRDGLKPVQRRILTTMFEMNDGRYHKVANVIGETMKLHPHGDASIGDALVVLANKEYFIDKQGNYGSVVTGHRAAAPRYIECRLTPLALETMFNKHLTEKAPSYDGRKDEPVFLPVKLPVVLLLGTEGIAVGMSTRILPHNFEELLRAQIRILQKKSFTLHPDFPQGGQVDLTEYDEGRGKVRVRARIERRTPKLIAITQVPYGTTTESLITSIENAAQKGKVKIGGIQDFTTDTVEIQINLPRGVDAEETIPQLYAYTDCEIGISLHPTVIDNRHPADMTTGEVLVQLTKLLKNRLRDELQWELDQLEDKRHWLTLEQIFIEKRVYKAIEEARTEEAVRKAVKTGMAKYKKLFVRPMVDEDITRLLEIRIRRISLWDIEKNRRQIEEIEAEIGMLKRKLRNMSKTTIAFLEDLIDRYGERWPRRTEVTKFETVNLRKVARSNIRVAYDPETGFWGSAVKGKEHVDTLSEYDRVLLIASDGSYRIVGPEEKVLIPGKLLYCARFDEKKGVEFTVVYRDKDRMCYGKRIHILKFVRAREYFLIKDRAGKIDILTQDDEPGTVHLNYVPKKRQRVKETTYDLNQLTLTGAGRAGLSIGPQAGRPGEAGAGRRMILDDLAQAIGNTPMLRLSRFAPNTPATLLAKLELFNPFSLKDRPVLSMVEAAEADGRLQPGGEIVEATSGNTGMALAMISTVRGYRCTLVMSEIQSMERRQVLAALGADLVLTRRDGGTKAARETAKRIAKDRGAFYLGQHDNPANPAAHVATGEEIWEATGGNVDVIVAGLGTSGTLMGIGQALKKRRPSLELIGVEPEESPFISQGIFRPHRMMGTAPGFVPAVLDRDQLDGVELCSEAEAFAGCRELARTEGLLAGISAGAAATVARRIAQDSARKGQDGCLRCLRYRAALSVGGRFVSVARFRRTLILRSNGSRPYRPR